MHPESKNTSVPWTGWDVLLFLAAWFVAQVVCAVIAFVVCGVVFHFTSVSPQSSESVSVVVDGKDEQGQPIIQVVEKEKKEYGHPASQLIEQGKDSPIVLLIVFLAIVVAAPLCEELLFRLLFQGWLEAKLLRYRIPNARAIAIVAVSVCFAALHAGGSGNLDWEKLLLLFGAFTVSNLWVFTLGIIYLVFVRNVNITRCFFGNGPFFPPHFFTYAGYCLLALALFQGVSGFLADTDTNLVILIFFFSLLLGTVYSKTQNLSYCILLHALLNGASFALAFFTA